MRKNFHRVIARLVQSCPAERGLKQATLPDNRHSKPKVQRRPFGQERSLSIYSLNSAFGTLRSLRFNTPGTESGQKRKTSRVNRYNEKVKLQNRELEKLLKDFPYEIEFVEYLSDEDLLRNRYQFVLRNIYASGEAIKAMLKYEDQPSEAGYVSVIPLPPNNTSIKNFPRKTLLHKFYIRQNIAKNVYVGEWDADTTWQKALTNYIGNMMQFFNKGN